MFYSLDFNMLVLEHLGLKLMVTEYVMENIVVQVHLFFCYMGLCEKKKNPMSIKSKLGKYYYSYQYKLMMIILKIKDNT